MNVIYSAKDAGVNCLAYSGRAIEKAGNVLSSTKKEEGEHFQW